MPIRVLVVDDDDLVRNGLRAILALEEGVQVVGEAASAAEGLEQVERLKPQVVLMDLRLGGMGGIEACRLVKAAHPEVSVLVLTVSADEQAVVAAIMAGASGYLLKGASGAALVSGVRSVASGESILDPAVTKAVLERFLALNRELEAANKELGALNQHIQGRLNVLFGRLQEIVTQEQQDVESLGAEAAKARFAVCLRRVAELIAK